MPLTPIKLPSRYTCAVVTSVGLAVTVVGILIRRLYRQRSSRRTVDRSGEKTRKNGSYCSVPLHSDSCANGIIDILRRLDYAVANLELKNRSEKESDHNETLMLIVTRLRALEADIRHLVDESGSEKAEDHCRVGTEDYHTSNVVWSSSSAPRAITLSVLSDDSFITCLDEPFAIEDGDILLKEPLSLAGDELLIYNEGLKAVTAGDVVCRKYRTELCGCDSNEEFMAKVWCLRKAFAQILSNEHNRNWLGLMGRQMIANLLRHANKDPAPFYVAYDAMLAFLNEEDNVGIIEKELRERKVSDLGFWDVVMDFIVLDCFEDLSRPPSAVLAVVRNMFLSHSVKESTLSTVIWSLLKAKRTRLTVPDGFIAHFYDISEIVSPPITLGFLGNDCPMKELCQYFKEQICAFTVDIFNIGRVRYTSVSELAEDVLIRMKTRTEMIQIRFNSELFPPT